MFYSFSGLWEPPSTTRRDAPGGPGAVSFDIWSREIVYITRLPVQSSAGPFYSKSRVLKIYSENSPPPCCRHRLVFCTRHTLTEARNRDICCICYIPCIILYSATCTAGLENPAYRSRHGVRSLILI